MFSQDFVTLLKLKADVIKEMFQRDTVQTGPVPAPCHCRLEKGLRKKRAQKNQVPYHVEVTYFDFQWIFIQRCKLMAMDRLN